MSTVPQFLSLLAAKGSPVRYRRTGDSFVLCPCRTDEGFRDPRFHLSIGSYGPQTITPIAQPGGIAANQNVWIAFEASDGTANASPRVVRGPFTLGVPFKLHLSDMKWPDRGQADRFIIYHSFDGVNFIAITTMVEPRDIFADDAVPFSDPPYSPLPILCNERAEIPSAPVDISVKAFVQPIQSTRATRLNDEILTQMFGEVQADDHLGIFPIEWNSTELNFRDWSQSGDEFIEYDGQRFLVVNTNKIPDPADGNPNHHWEVGLRLISSEAVTL